MNITFAKNFRESSARDVSGLKNWFSARMDLTINKTYSVFAIYSYDNFVYYLLISDGGLPYFYPCDLFIINDGNIPYDWEFNFITNNKGINFIISRKEICKIEFVTSLMEREKDTMAFFFKIVQEVQASMMIPDE